MKGSIHLFFAALGLLLTMFSGILTLYAIASGRFDYATAAACVTCFAVLFFTINMIDAERL